MDSLSYGVTDKSYVDNNNYVMYDINKLGTDATIKVISKLNPSIVIFFSFKSLSDLYLLRLCKYIGVNTLYMQHGIYGSNIFKFRSRKIISSIYRYYHLLLLYANFIFSFCPNLISEIIILLKFLYSNDYKNTKFDKALLYSEKNLGYINKKFKFQKDNIYYAGYPLFYNEKGIRKSPKKIKGNRKKVLFIQQNFRSGLSEISVIEEKKYFYSIVEMCNKLELEFHIKLHPRVNKSEFIDLFQGLDVCIESDIDLYEFIRSGDIIVGHFSSALFAGVLLNKPIISLFYPKYLFPTKIFEKIGLIANNFESLEKILDRPKTWGRKMHLYEQFREEYIGFNNTYSNQANQIIKILNAS